VPFARIHSPLCSAVLLLSTACSGDLLLPNEGSGSRAIRVVAGESLAGQVSQLVEDPVVVEVTDTSGNPIPNAAVEFVFISAGDGAAILPPTAVTDASGRAEAYLRLGDKVGPQTGEARLMVNGASAAKAGFTAVAAAAPDDNRAPVADFNWHCEDLSCQFTDASNDPDGDVTAWSWQFGDDETSDQTEPLHVYAQPGTYTVTLRVTDNAGATDQTSTPVEVTVSVPPPSENKPPRADFDVHCHDQFCSFTDRSRDDDGTVVSWTWDFGDGTASTSRNPFHFYREEGKFDVTLTVTDNDGTSATKTHRADVKD